MSALPVPLRLADMGQTLWGPRWTEPMAKALSVTEKDIVEWDANPDTLPACLEDRLAALAEERVQEINGLASRLEVAGLKRGRPD